MPENRLSIRGAAAPNPYDNTKVEHGLANLEAALASCGDALREAALAELGRPGARRLIEALFGNSPYLSRTLIRDLDFLPDLFSQPPGALLSGLITDIGVQAVTASDQETLMRELRKAKTHAALLIACADVAGLWTLEDVTGALSRFADAALQATVKWLLQDAARKGQILLSPDDLEGAPTGFVILGMGKYGADELNYSSDIDLVVLFEPDILPLKPELEPADFFVRLTRAIVKIMQERTADGYVFRTDLRLRPDPGGTAVAVSLPAAEIYYESRGQNWERAAFIKARAVAGDLAAGVRFLSGLAPFIWRKHLDFAAIEDVHSMKRQIHAVGGHGKIAVAGHNIKLGRGGIREIEFFVQTQQLIAGGRDQTLRGRQTCAMLDALAAAQWITADTAEELKSSYRFFRRLEHRLQMVADEQTHTLPSTPEGLDHIACFMGFESTDAFSTELVGHLSRVQNHYAALFESAPPLAEESGSLVFTGTEDDPETVETLTGLGFKNASDMSGAIRAWHSGRFAATRSPRSRERLTALMPVLLRALSKTADPDTAFTRFDQFLTGLPAGVQLFSMLYSNPSLLDLLADICGTAPRLASYLSRNQAVLEAVVDPDFFSVLPEPAALSKSLTAALVSARDYQDALDFARVWAREHRFRLGVRILSGSADAAEAGPAYAAIAKEIIAGLEPFARRQIEARHGTLPGGRAVIVGMGKLGSREMSAESDLDLIMIYDMADLEQESDGEKPLYAAQYYGRFCQQLINALTAPTAEGALYQVDMRLRPSGNAGPVATQLSRFAAYQASEAWTWEHMALTRARVVVGPEDLARDVSNTIRDTLCRRRDRAKTATDVVDMRARIEREYPSDNPWELKHVRGGLIDMEFIVQYLQLIHAHEHPGILNVHTRSSLAAAGRLGVIEAERADALLAALDLNHNLTQIIRICVTGVFEPENTTDGLKTLLARAGDAPGFSILEAQLIESQMTVRRAFDEIVARDAGTG